MYRVSEVQFPEGKTLNYTRIICLSQLIFLYGGSPRVMVSTAAFPARARGLFPSLGGLKETKMILRHPLVKLSIVGSLPDREVASSASNLQGLNFESCVWRAVSSHTPHHLQDVLLAQFNLYVHKCGLMWFDLFHFFFQYLYRYTFKKNKA